MAQRTGRQDHPLYTLLHDAANDWTAASTFREEITRDALLQRQGGFGFVNRVGGKPVELIRLNPYRTPVFTALGYRANHLSGHRKGEHAYIELARHDPYSVAV